VAAALVAAHQQAAVLMVSQAVGELVVVVVAVVDHRLHQILAVLAAMAALESLL
jgi:hypothetical protein